MNMRILLTGSTGYLGSHLADKLLAQGHSIVALKRKTSSLQRLKSILPKITLIEVEELDFNDAFKDYGKIDVVIHTAACYGRSGESISQIVEANLNFPLKLMDAAMAAGVQLFINTDTALEKSLNSYSLSKRQFVEWGHHLSRKCITRFINLKLEHIYGEGDDDAKFTTHVIKSCLMNVPELKLTLGEQERDFIYIKDAVAVYQLLLEKQELLSDWFVEFEVGSGKAVSIRKFVESVHKLTASKTYLNFGAQPYRVSEQMFSQADTQPLQKLGWSCKYNLEQGLKLAIEGHKK